MTSKKYLWVEVEKWKLPVVFMSHEKKKRGRGESHFSLAPKSRPYSVHNFYCPLKSLKVLHKGSLEGRAESSTWLSVSPRSQILCKKSIIKWGKRHDLHPNYSCLHCHKKMYLFSYILLQWLTIIFLYHNPFDAH